MAAIITPQTAAASSADFTIAAGANASLYLIPAAGDGWPLQSDPTVTAQVFVKTPTGYASIGFLTIDNIFRVLTAPGTFRVTKLLTSVSFGVGLN